MRIERAMKKGRRFDIVMLLIVVVVASVPPLLLMCGSHDRAARKERVTVDSLRMRKRSPIKTQRRDTINKFNNVSNKLLW
jgi:hypothetical protein